MTARCVVVVTIEESDQVRGRGVSVFRTKDPHNKRSKAWQANLSRARQIALNEIVTAARDKHQRARQLVLYIPDADNPQ
jgi:hypothetical protein